MHVYVYVRLYACTCVYARFYERFYVCLYVRLRIYEQIHIPSRLNQKLENLERRDLREHFNATERRKVDARRKQAKGR